jgi:hypothetical protein
MKAPRESEIKGIMIRSVKMAGGYARRIEDQFAVGMPDTILIPKGYPVFFAEVKIVTGQQFGPSPRQYIELCRIGETWGSKQIRYAIPILIGYRSGVFYFHEVREMVRLDECFSVTSRPMDFNDQLIQFYNGRIYK